MEKKLLAFLLAMMMILVNVAVLAEDEIPQLIVDVVPRYDGQKEEVDPYLTKTYTTEGTNTKIYPTGETLTFDVSGYEDVDITVADVTLDGSSTYTIAVTVPAASEYGEAGKYHYEIRENKPEVLTQGASYDTRTFNVDVWIFYNEEGELDQVVNIYSGDETDENATTKDDKVKNEYAVGELEIKKEIDGNLADPERNFDFEVTLTATGYVANDITIVTTGYATVSGEKTIAAGWSNTTKTIKFTARGGDSIVIKDIPKGVTYTVEEQGIEDITADQQIEKANALTAYEIEYDGNESGTIGTDTASTTITNTKGITVPTGIAVDYIPFVLIVVFAGMAAVTLTVRRKKEN